MRSLITESDLESVIEVDGALSADEMTLDCAKQLERQVWGQGFSAPLFFDEFEVLDYRILADKHLKLILQKANKSWDAVMFNHIEAPPSVVKMVYQLQANRFNGAEKVQLNVRHIIS